MAGNRSLDDFVEAGSSTETAEDVDQIEPTYTWSPTGGGCAVCGAIVDRRWRDGDSLVCSECKSW